MHPSYLQRCEAHFRVVKGDTPYDISSEVEYAKTNKDVRTLVPLSREGIQYFSTMFQPVKSAADLDLLPRKLSKDEEYGFSPLFDPALVDACCTRGIFPLALDIGGGHYLYAPKVHQNRAICALVSSPAERNTISGFPFCDDNEGIFDHCCVGISKKLLKTPDESTRRPAFQAFVNREEDLVDVFTLIRKQHGENWLCKPLRLCLFHIFLNPEKYKTRIIITAVRRVKYAGEAVVTDAQEVGEGELVAGEVGFLVGDVYTSASGAYCVSGGGALQLCFTANCMRAAGCRVWDLGMMMEYKKRLNCCEVPRMKWLQIMKVRSASPNASIVEALDKGRDGCDVSAAFARPLTQESPDPNSKAQMKKRLRLEAVAKRKAEKKQESSSS